MVGRCGFEPITILLRPARGRGEAKDGYPARSWRATNPGRSARRSIRRLPRDRTPPARFWRPGWSQTATHVVPPEGLEPSPSAFVALRPIRGTAAFLPCAWMESNHPPLPRRGSARPPSRTREDERARCAPGIAGSRLPHRFPDAVVFSDNPVASARGTKPVNELCTWAVCIAG
jgi:hypothetical protein